MALVWSMARCAEFVALSASQDLRQVRWSIQGCWSSPPTLCERVNEASSLSRCRSIK